MEHSYILFFVNQSTGAVDCEREERCAGNCLLIRVVPRVQPRPYFGIEVFCFVLYGRETERRTTILRDDMKIEEERTLVIIMDKRASREQIQKVIAQVELLGLKTYTVQHNEQTRILAIGNTSLLNNLGLESWGGVQEVAQIRHPFKLASRQFQPKSTIISIGDVTV